MNHYKTVEEALSYTEGAVSGIVIYQTKKQGVAVGSFGKLILMERYALVGYANVALAVDELNRHGRLLPDPRDDEEEEEGKDQ